MDLNIVKFIQKANCGFMDGLNTVITILGETSMFFMLFVAIYLCYRKDFAVKYLFFFMINGLVNGAIKGVVKRARPYTYDGVFDVRHTTGYSFPSGHSQNFALQATLIGNEYYRVDKNKKHRTILTVSLCVIGLLVGFSRVYLGQHFLTDVLAGLVLGVIIGFGLDFIIRIIPEKIKKKITPKRLLFALIPVVLLLLVLIEYFGLGSESMQDTFYTYLAIYVALLVGYTIDVTYIKYDESAVWYVQLFKIILAGLGIVGLSFAFSWIKVEMVRNFVFYFSSTLYVTLVLPLLFKFLIKDKSNKNDEHQKEEHSNIQEQSKLQETEK